MTGVQTCALPISFEEEFDASESGWDLWDEEEAQDPDNEETDEEEYWKKEGDDHSWTS